MIEKLITVAMFVAFLAIFTAGIAWIFMALWNFAAAPLFHAPRFGFLQAWALWGLVSIVGALFRGGRDGR